MKSIVTKKTAKNIGVSAKQNPELIDLPRPVRGQPNGYKSDQSPNHFAPESNQLFPNSLGEKSGDTNGQMVVPPAYLWGYHNI